jgi:tetratricopeptide (TPR) repeat protein
MPKEPMLMFARLIVATFVPAALLCSCAAANPVRTVMVRSDTVLECSRLAGRIECTPFGQENPNRTAYSWTVDELGLDAAAPGIERCRKWRICALRAPVALPDEALGDWIVGDQDSGSPFLIHRVPKRPDWILVSDGDAYVTTPVRGDNGEIWLAGLRDDAPVFRLRSSASGWAIHVGKDQWQPLQSPVDTKALAWLDKKAKRQPHQPPQERLARAVRGHMRAVNQSADPGVRRLLVTQARQYSQELSADDHFWLHLGEARSAMQDGDLPLARGQLKKAVAAYAEDQQSRYSRLDKEALTALYDLRVEVEERAEQWRAAIKIREQQRDAFDPAKDGYCAVAHDIAERYFGLGEMDRVKASLALAPACGHGSFDPFMALADKDPGRAIDLLAADQPGGSPSTAFGRRTPVNVHDAFVASIFHVLQVPEGARRSVLAMVRSKAPSDEQLFALAAEYNVLPEFVQAVQGSPKIAHLDISQAQLALRQGKADAIKRLERSADAAVEFGDYAPWFALARAQRQAGDTRSARRSYEQALVRSGRFRPIFERLWANDPLDLSAHEAAVQTAALNQKKRWKTGSLRFVLAASKTSAPADRAALLADFMDDSWFKNHGAWAWERADEFARQTPPGPTTAPTLVRYWRHRALRARTVRDRIRFEQEAKAQVKHLPAAERGLWTALADAKAGKTIDLDALRTSARSSAPMMRQLSNWALGVAIKDDLAAQQRLLAAFTANADEKPTPFEIERQLQIACDVVHRTPDLKISFNGRGLTRAALEFWTSSLRTRCKPTPDAAALKRWRALLGRWEMKADARKQLRGRAIIRVEAYTMEFLADGRWRLHWNGDPEHLNYVFRATAEDELAIDGYGEHSWPSQQVQLRLTDQRLEVTGLKYIRGPAVFTRVSPVMPSP